MTDLEPGNARPHGHEPLGWSAAALAMLCAALWGGTAVAIRFSVDTVPPIALAGLRFGIAALFMWGWCWWGQSALRLRRHEVRSITVAGLLLFVQIATFNVGILWSNSSHGSLLINTYIFWVVAIEHFFVRAARLNTRKLLGLLMAAVGCALVVLTDRPSQRSSVDLGDPATLSGDLMLIASSLILGIKTYYTKVATHTVEPGKLMFWHDVVGTVLFAASSALWEHTNWNGFTTPAILGLLYQGVVVAGFCFAVTAHLLRRHSASEVSVFSFATPLFGLVLGIWLRGDVLSLWIVVSGTLVALGIWLVTRNGTGGE